MKIYFSVLSILLFSLNVFAVEQDKSNTLTLHFPNAKERVAKIKSIKVSDSGIAIDAQNSAYCFLPFKEIYKSVPKPTCKAGEAPDYSPVRKEYNEIFTNAKDPSITCVFDSSNKVIAFHFTGKTTLKGEPVLIAKGSVLNMSSHTKEYPIEEDTDNEELEKLGVVFGKILLYGISKY